MGLTQLLGVSAVSLGAHRVSSATASNNLQNVNTPGYARQRALLAEGASTLQQGVRLGSGVRAAGVQQQRDPWVESRVPAALQDSGFSRAQSSMLASLSALNPDTPGGVGSAMGAFFNAWRALGQNAGSLPLRTATLQATQDLAASFNGAASAILAARQGADAQLGAVVPQAQQAAATVARLNGDIRRLAAGGPPPLELLDQRQAAMDQLSTLTGARAVAQDNGDVSMVLQGGAALVSGTNVGQLSLVVDPTNSGLRNVVLRRVDGSSSMALGLSDLGGEVAGLLTARDGALAQAGRDLDTLAVDLSSALNAVHQGGFGTDGSTGNNLLDVAGPTVGAAQRMKVDAAVANQPARLGAANSLLGLPGGSEQALLLAGVQSAALPSGGTPTSLFANLVGSYGSATSSALHAADGANSARDVVLALRESASGVSSDEETVLLMQAQRGFEASMKVLITADEMLDTLMNLR